MDSVFDRLAREISTNERRTLLHKIEQSLDMPEEPLRLDDASSNEPVVLDREFSELPFFSRLRILFLGFFTGRGRTKLTEEYLLGRVRRKVDRAAPGLVDFRRGLVGPSFYEDITKLKAAVDVFRRALIRALEGDKADFYAILGRMEFEDIHRRLVEEVTPEEVVADDPDALPAEVKRSLEDRIDRILGDIIPDRRRRMKAHTTALARLRALTSFRFERILDFFPPGDSGASAAASLREITSPLLELGGLLYAFREPPSLSLLESLFLFELQEHLSSEGHKLENELLDRMDRARASLDTIRDINTRIPWIPLMKIVASDLQYSPTPPGGGEDWFRIYSRFWRERTSKTFRIWADRRRLQEILKGLTVLWGRDAIAMVPGYREEDFPSGVPLRHATSFAAIRSFFLEMLPGRLYHALNLISIDGKFYKKDNRVEYDTVFSNMLKMPDKVRALEARLRPEGELGSRRAELIRLTKDGLMDLASLIEIARTIDRESQILVVPALGDLASLGKLLKGILDGNGGPYDTLANMSEIGGQGHDTLRASLREIQILVEKSSITLTDLVNLEEKRILS